MTGGGFVLAHGGCFGCGQPFAFNPARVPSINIGGERWPVCIDCVDLANEIRIANGLPIIVPAPDAYEPMPESELLP